MSDKPPLGWVLFDASCGICARGVPWWSATFARLGLATAALQESWVTERTGLPAEELLHDLSILFVDGSVVRGADAYRWVLRRRWWGWPLWLVALVPPGSWLFNGAYRWFARNRHRASRICGLSVRASGSPGVRKSGSQTAKGKLGN